MIMLNSIHVRYILVIIVTSAIAFSSGKFLTKPEVQTKIETKVVYQDRIVKDETKDIAKHIVDVKKPDGSETITTDIGEKDANHTAETKDQTSTSTQTTSTQSRPTWRVGGVFSPTIPLVQPQTYGAILERQVFSEVYAGVIVRSDRTLGFALTVGF